jgi:DNA-binding beta-propeller fold protein YncE
MYGPGFTHPGDDVCSPRRGIDNSFVYRIDVASGRQVKRIGIGPYPRGIAVAPSSRTAYVAVIGGRDIVTIDLFSFAVGRIRNVGGAHRRLRRGVGVIEL